MDHNKLNHELVFDCRPHERQLLCVLNEIQDHIKKTGGVDQTAMKKILCRHPYENKNLFRLSHLLEGYKYLVTNNALKEDSALFNAIRMKPMRTQSGVTPVTVLTKPFPCPGKCIFCPNDVRMPKSYLADEPGAQRAERNSFDPYLQTYNRLLAFQAIGHAVDKIELIILGGTWSFYPEYYQIWFIKRCFDAMNDFPLNDRRDEVKTQNIFNKLQHPGGAKNTRKSYNEIITDVAGGKVQGFFQDYEKATWKELEMAHTINETAQCRNVGLVIETRPDSLDEKEVIKSRHFGATKIQIGIQSLDDSIMKLNKRGHSQKETQKAIDLLRLAGFKIHAHWMPNLYGATPDSDIKDYQKLWGPQYSPDELKIYPTSIIANTELNDLFEEGKYKPYTHEELLQVLTSTIPYTPRYARLTRIVRDIPSTDIVEGNKFTNFRQIAEKEILSTGKKLGDIRSREVKNLKVTLDDLELETIKYETSVSTELFISYKTKENEASGIPADKIAGFLRLSFPKKELSAVNFLKEIRDSAMIREVHVYGQVVGIGKKVEGKAQHLGLGTLLTELASTLAKKEGFSKLAVISAIGTREYYRKRGFKDEGLYLIKNL